MRWQMLYEYVFLFLFCFVFSLFNLPLQETIFLFFFVCLDDKSDACVKA